MKDVKTPKVLINEEFMEFIGDYGLEQVVDGSVVELPEINTRYQREVYQHDTVYCRVDH